MKGTKGGREKTNGGRGVRERERERERERKENQGRVSNANFVLLHAWANANALGMWSSARDKAEKRK